VNHHAMRRIAAAINAVQPPDPFTPMAGLVYAYDFAGASLANTAPGSDIGSLIQGSSTMFDGYMTVGTTSSTTNVPTNGKSSTATPEFTLGCWFRRTGGTAQAELMSRYTGSTNSATLYRLHLFSSNTIRLLCMNGSTSTIGPSYTQAGSFTDSTWHHTIASFTNGAQFLLLDGVQVATTARAFDNSTVNTLATGLGTEIGPTVTRRFTGQLSGFRYYNRGLSLEEAQAWYASVSPPF
jgi:hypothetical protein